MKKDKRFLVIKEIPIKGGKNIPVNTSIYRTHDVYYMDGGLLPKDYQEDFDALIEHEENYGWKYLSPVITKTAFKNEKEGLN
jgi:hypothetical protein